MGSDRPMERDLDRMAPSPRSCLPGDEDYAKEKTRSLSKQESQKMIGI